MSAAIARYRSLGRLVGAVLFVAAGAAQADSPRHPALENPAAVDAVIDGLVDEGAYPFLYARVEDREGHVLYEHGKRNPELMPFDVDGDDWVRVWSMSKIVTIVTVLDLVEEGVLSLDDPVTRWIPEFADLKVATGPNGENLTQADETVKDAACPVTLAPMTEVMTVRQLLNHQAGFYYSWNGVACIDQGFRAADLPLAADGDELIERFAKLPLINQPGANFHYGTGTTVLGLVAERATGRTLAQLVAERVTGPLGIEGLQYGLPEGVTLPPRVSGADGSLRLAHDGELDIFGAHVVDYDPDHTLYLGGEGMLGTADGYADFARMLLRRGELNGYRLLNDATIEDLTAPHTLTDSEFGHNGYNLWIANGRLSNGEAGPGPLWIGGGYEKTHFWIDPERQFVGVILSQAYATPPQAQGSDERIRMAIYEQLGWRPAPAPPVLNEGD